VKLRDYQQNALDAIAREFEDKSSTLAVLPTGTGKTVLFAHVAQSASSGRVMVLAHREELITQAADKIHRVMGQRPDIEMAGRWANDSMFGRSRVVVSSIQTQIAGANGGRMRRFKPDDFGLVIIDEAHHAPARSYRKVIEHYRQNPACKVLGVTATPDRADEEALGQVFESVAFVYEVVDAIRDGYLVPISQRSVMVEGLDFSDIRTTAGDLNGADLEAVMTAEKMLHQIASPTIELSGDRKTLLFCTSVKHAEAMSEILNRHRAECARWVCGETPGDERRQTLADYAAGRFQYLCNVGVLTEGFDDPGIQVVAIARPTKSRALYAQMVGRGTRPLPGLIDGVEQAEDRRRAILLSGKTEVEVLDFVGNSGRHKLVCAADILGGKYSDEAVELATKMLHEDGQGNVIDALEKAQEELDRKAREAEEAKQREIANRAKVVGKARFQTRNVNPFDILSIQPVREHLWDAGKTLTEKQITMLQRAGIPTENLSVAEARRLCQEIVSRWKSGKCTFKQAAMLKRFGYSTDCSMMEASRVIDAVKAAGWRVPRGEEAMV